MVCEALRRSIDLADESVLRHTQDDIVSMGNGSRPFQSAALGNKLRATVAHIARELSAELDRATQDFRNAVLNFVSASDDDIFRKRVVVQKSGGSDLSHVGLP